MQAVVRDAVARLDAFDLPGFCRDFAPEALDRIPQLHGATGCDDPRLTTIMAHCQGCQKHDEILAISVAVTAGTAVARITIKDDPRAVTRVDKPVRAVQSGTAWLLLDSPEATLP